MVVLGPGPRESKDAAEVVSEEEHPAMAAIGTLKPVLHGAHGGAGLEERDVFSAPPAAPPHRRPIRLVPHVDWDLDEVAGAGPHLLEVPGLAAEGSNKGFVLGVPDEVVRPAKGVSASGLAQRQATKAASLGDSANAPDHLLRKNGLGHAPPGEACVEARHGVGPLVAPAALQKNHEPGKGPHLDADGLPQRYARVAGHLDKLVDGVEYREHRPLRETAEGGMAHEDLHHPAVHGEPAATGAESSTNSRPPRGGDSSAKLHEVDVRAEGFYLEGADLRLMNDEAKRRQVSNHGIECGPRLLLSSGEGSEVVDVNVEPHPLDHVNANQSTSLGGKLERAAVVDELCLRHRTRDRSLADALAEKQGPREPHRQRASPQPHEVLSSEPPSADDVPGHAKLGSGEAIRKSEPSPKLVVDAHMMKSILDVADGKGHGRPARLVGVTPHNFCAAEPFSGEERNARRRGKTSVRPTRIQDESNALSPLLVYEKYPYELSWVGADDGELDVIQTFHEAHVVPPALLQHRVNIADDGAVQRIQKLDLLVGAQHALDTVQKGACSGPYNIAGKRGLRHVTGHGEQRGLVRGEGTLGRGVAIIAGTASEDLTERPFPTAWVEATLVHAVEDVVDGSNLQ